MTDERWNWCAMAKGNAREERAERNAAVELVDWKKRDEDGEGGS